MKKPVLLAVLAAFLTFGSISCSDDRGYDPVPGPNTDEPEPEIPTTDLAMQNVEDPRIAKDNEYYWIFSSNHDMNDEDYPYENGLMVRRTENLIDFSIMGYVLSDVIDDWAKEKLVSMQGAINQDNIRMRRPAVAKVGDEWRLYYTVNAGMDVNGDNATVIGYATSPSLDNPEWTDKGEVMSSVSVGGSGPIAANPCFFTSLDGSEHYLLYGERTGFYVTKLDENSKPTGTPTLVAKQGDRTSQAYMYIHKNRFYLLFSFEHASMPQYSYIFLAQSINPAGPFIDYSPDDRDVAKVFPENRILTPYHFGGTKWGNFNTLSIVNTGIRDVIATHTKANLDQSQPFVLQIRELDWVETPKDWDFPCISTDPYVGDIGKVTAADIAGDWGYGTLWYDVDNNPVNNCRTDLMVFNKDNTVIGPENKSGTWDFDETTSTLHFVATWWNNEDVYVKVRKVKDTDSPEAVENISASGFNATFWHHPGVWMKKNLE